MIQKTVYYLPLSHEERHSSLWNAVTTILQSAEIKICHDVLFALRVLGYNDIEGTPARRL